MNVAISAARRGIRIDEGQNAKLAGRRWWARFMTIVTLVSLWTGTVFAATPYKATPGPFAVHTLKLTWHDPARNRNIPVKIYYPNNGRDAPVIVFSPGLGATRDNYGYLGEHWASYGYVVMVVQHPGSDDRVWRGNPDPLLAMRRAATEVTNYINRPRDISFALDELTRLDSADNLPVTPDDPQGGVNPLRGRLDLAHIGAAGHSFGAFDTQTLIGERLRFVGDSLADPRVSAAIVMSPTLSKRQNPDYAFGAILVPVFYMTGTRDQTAITTVTPAQRELPFEHGRGPDQYLLVLKGADHMVFSGQSRRNRLWADTLFGNGAPPASPGSPAEGTHDQAFHSLILQASTAFWDAYLRHDHASAVWLNDGGFTTELGNLGTFAIKRVSARKSGGTADPEAP